MPVFCQVGTVCLTLVDWGRRLSLLSILHLYTQGVHQLGSVHGPRVGWIVPK